MDEEFEESLGFARKYRANSLKEYVGNAGAKDTIIRYLKKKRKPQTFMLEGASGCGKTTLSRIIAKEYCCEDRDEEMGACGVCPTCQLFDEYIKYGKTDMLPDMYEVDATDKSGKEDMNQLLESMEYPAMSGEWKVYILDEVHKLSNSAESRLLKVLEEPNAGVLIILCTTDPDQVLPTIKNRCEVKCQISRPTTKEAVERLQKVCVQEDKEYDLAGLRMITAWSENVLRDCLNNLDTVLNTRGNACSDSVSSQFKTVSDNLIFEFYNAYYEDDYVNYANIMYKIKMQYGFKQFVTTLTSFTIRGLYIINSVDVDSLSEEELSSYLKLFKKFSPSDISRILSQLKQMLAGDIEANLLSFIYCKRIGETEGGESIKGNVIIPEEVVSIEDERLMRNSNLERLEIAKLDEGKTSIQSELQEVGVDDLGDFFNLEKVN